MHHKAELTRCERSEQSCSMKRMPFGYKKTDTSSLSGVLYTMMLIRFFEEKVEEVFTTGTVRGTAHTCIGQEAIPVAVAQNYTKGGLNGGGDVITSTHRGHGHFIALGADVDRVMGELLGKETGYSQGRGGSQLMADYNLGFIGANGIVAGSAAPATGMALAFKQRNEDRVALCYLGDGALAQGSLHEAMNMAGLWDLPVLFLVEFNKYAMSTPARAALANQDLSLLCASHNLEYAEVDGNDYFALDKTIAHALDSVRAGKPLLLRCNTYRQSGHSRGDKRVYRTREEEQRWAENDPLEKVSRYMLEHGWDTTEIEGLKSKAKDAVSASLTNAQQAPYPNPDSMNEGVFQ